MRQFRSLAGGFALLAATMGAASAQAPAAPVSALSTGTLAALCAASPEEPQGATANGFCRGFLIGVGQYQMALSRPGGINPAFCLPDPAPTLEVAQAAFVAWVNANPQYRDDKAVDGLLRWAATTYPCAAPAPRRARR